ncbi:CxxH/CxxC protein [Aureibacillus halotolerans]|uniref:CxxH/CxxC protein (TIGR04129 family) n=1 Tax=Aureibacillus halotolerans TaxID=1508390 RepID=A0A4R6TWY3_9BACI|nr:CxxH/CxxC protein [Aureibacillus halotolerans]TDQ38390.1 CxxH/CxxC protein (TIGR04129 family) [Aureibacillus halotolerans]
MEIRDIPVCQEHVELALDIIVDEYETAPAIEQRGTDEERMVCEFCQETAQYVVSNRDAH